MHIPQFMGTSIYIFHAILVQWAVTKLIKGYIFCQKIIPLSPFYGIISLSVVMYVNFKGLFSWFLGVDKIIFGEKYLKGGGVIIKKTQLSINNLIYLDSPRLLSVNVISATLSLWKKGNIIHTWRNMILVSHVICARRKSQVKDLIYFLHF